MTLINDINFSDIYVAENKVCYITDDKTENGLAVLQAEDLSQFLHAMESAWDKVNPSYSLFYERRIYRIERSEAIYGTIYCGRKMPAEVPRFMSLGFDSAVSEYLLGLNNASGLILTSGPTGAGKTTTLSALLKEYLMYQGGFAYTIEDPAEMPLDGIYKSVRGGLGICKQTPPPNGDWGLGLKSALRSKPRYIFVGEIRTPETASECLRAATSGHLVLSSVHANNISDAINSVVKYASAAAMSEDLAFDLFSRGMLGVMHQTLHGVKRRQIDISFLFANPITTAGDQVRGIIKTGKLNLSTVIEQQAIKMKNRMPLFTAID